MALPGSFGTGIVSLMTSVSRCPIAWIRVIFQLECNIHMTSIDVFSKDVSAQMVVLFNFGTLPPLYLLLPL